MEIHSAEKKDYVSIQKLLTDVKLPIDGVENHLRDFIILFENDKLIGTAGLEIYGEYALLRSLAVAEDHQRKGYGSQLYHAIVVKAQERNISELYLLTETAEDFFASQGFENISRKLVPDAVKTSVEFQSVCPETAACMQLKLN